MCFMSYAILDIPILCWLLWQISASFILDIQEMCGIDQPQPPPRVATPGAGTWVTAPAAAGITTEFLLKAVRHRAGVRLKYIGSAWSWSPPDGFPYFQADSMNASEAAQAHLNHLTILNVILLHQKTLSKAVLHHLIYHPLSMCAAAIPSFGPRVVAEDQQALLMLWQTVQVLN